MNSNGQGNQPTSFWLDDATRTIMDDLTSKTGMSRSAVVREAVKLMHSDSSNAEIRRLVKELSRAVGT